jgi:hypothetical protein
MAQITSCTSIGTLLNNNKKALTFDEFELFTGLSGTITNGFQNSVLKSIKCPPGKAINLTAFVGNTSISDLHIHGDCNMVVSAAGGNTFKNTGTLIIDGNATASTGTNYELGRFINYIIKGTFTSNGNQRYVISSLNALSETFRVKGNVSFGGSSQTWTVVRMGYNYQMKFIEMMGSMSLTTRATDIIGLVSNLIWHFGSSIIAHTGSNQSYYMTKVTKMYVGNGSSRSNDEATLALYIANSNWSSYSSKLATWYDYNGKYKWYYVTDVLTNCTNTNPDEWPHITRGEEYKTTIVANEGYTLGTVKVEMYSARDNALTPDEPTDITSSVYNASTGEIYIQEVVGNVIITASAS